MSEAKVNSEDIEIVFQRLRALPVNKVNMLKKTTALHTIRFYFVL